MCVVSKISSPKICASGTAAGRRWFGISWFHFRPPCELSSCLWAVTNSSRPFSSTNTSGVGKYLGTASFKQLWAHWTCQLAKNDCPSKSGFNNSKEYVSPSIRTRNWQLFWGKEKGLVDDLLLCASMFRGSTKRELIHTTFALEASPRH